MRCFGRIPKIMIMLQESQKKWYLLSFSGNEIDDYNKLVRLAGEQTAQETIKQILHEHLK